MSMKTIVAAQPRLKITVPIKHNGTVYTQSKTCVTAKSATHFYVGVKHVYYYRWLEQATGRFPHGFTPAEWAQLDARGERYYRRVLRVFKQYLP